MNQIKELRKANNSSNESVEASLEAFDMFSINCELEYKKFIDKSIKATIKTLYDVGHFDRFENEKEICKDYIIFKKRRKGE